MNKVILTGRVTRDPERRSSAQGLSVTRFTIAVAKNKDEADFINCVAFGDTADMCGKAEQGQMVLIEGKLKNDTYTNNNGQKITKTEVNVTWVELLSRAKSREDAEYKQVFGGKSEEISEEELPF